MENITFIASPNLSRGKIHLGKPRPLVVDVQDYKGFEDAIGEDAIGNEAERLNNLKITYFLNQITNSYIFALINFLI